MNYPPITNTFQKLTFGQYKGSSVEVIIDLDPAYIVSLCETNTCSVSESIYLLAKEMARIHQLADSL